MKARPKKPSARGTAAKKSAAAGKRAAVARKAPKPAKTASKHSPTALGADCTIEHAPGLQKQLAKVLADRACVTLDFSAVKRCDTAGMQVLAAFIRERREAGRDVELASMSENFLATVKLLGLGALFVTAEAGA
jgi:anti-anti-sigma regulatory factor